MNFFPPAKVEIQSFFRNHIHLSGELTLKCGHDPSLTGSKLFQEAENTQNNENGEVKVNQEFAKAILTVVQEVATSVYTQTLNTVVTQLFPNNYNDFKGIVDDFDSTNKGEQTQTAAPATNNNPQGAENASPTDASVNNQ